MGRTMLARSLEECTELLTQSIDMLTILQEDPTLHKLEAEPQELQQAYDQLWGTAQTVAIPQRLAKMREVQDMKIQAEVVRQKEVVVKVHIQPWLDEAFAVSTTIEHKVVHINAECAKMETAEIGAEILVPQVEHMQHMTEEFTASTSNARKLLTDLRAKMDAPAQ